MYMYVSFLNLTSLQLNRVSSFFPMAAVLQSFVELDDEAVLTQLPFLISVRCEEE